MLQKTTTKPEKRSKKQKQADQLNQFKQYFQENWFRGCCLCLLFFLLMKKDFSFQVNMNNTQISTAQEFSQNSSKESIAPTPKAAPVSQKVEAEEISEMSIFSIAKQEKVKPPVQANQKPVAKKIEVGVQAANNFANVSALLVRDFAKRYDITQAEVDQRRQTCEAYVKRFSSVAISEMKRYGVPASITLAQGLLESDAGSSRLSRNNQNHFGMKCFSKACKKGHCSNFSDDTHKDFFRKYNNAWESYRAHSILLQGKRYKSLKKYGVKDYKSWAHGLKKAGYATDKKYAEKLIKIIEAMNLNRFDV